MLYGTWYNTADGMHERISRALQLNEAEEASEHVTELQPSEAEQHNRRITFWIFQVQYL